MKLTIVTCAISMLFPTLARAEYSSAEFLRDTRQYTSNLLDSLRTTPNSTYNSPYHFGNHFEPAFEQKSSNWSRTYNAPPKPLTWEERQKAQREVEAQREREARRRAAEKELARIQEMQRQSDAELQRSLAAARIADAADAVRRAELERRAAAGDHAAILQSAKEAESQYRHGILRIIRAAKLGDLGSIRTLADPFGTIPAGVLPDDERTFWRKVAVEKGEPSVARYTAFALDKKGETAAAIDVLQAAYAITPDITNALQIVEFASNLSRHAEAFAYFKEAIALDTAGQSTTQITERAFGMPVNRDSAPVVLQWLKDRAADAGPDAPTAAIRLGDIYSGQVASWRGLTPLDAHYRTWYELAAQLKPAPCAAIAASRLAALADFPAAQRLFNTAVATKHPPSVFAAANFYATRADGKADGNLAIALYARVGRGGDLATAGQYPSDTQVGDIYFFGQGLPAPDQPKGLAYYQRGRANHNIAAVRRLAALTFAGESVPKDQAAALQMLDEVAAYNTTDSEGKNQAAFDALQLRFTRDLAAKPNDYRATCQKYERDLRTQTAAKFDPDPRAMELLGRALLAGDLGDNDDAAHAQAWKWIQRAARAGLPSAKTLVGLNLLAPGSTPSPENAQLAFELFFDAARSHNPAAAYGLALCYQNAYGTTRNLPEAKRWLTQAAAQGYDPAQTALANDAPNPQ